MSLQPRESVRTNDVRACVKRTKEDNMNEVIIKPQNDGPYHVKGRFKIVTEGGREFAFDGDETWLCRCGQSANKPFCDGSHKKAGFKSNLDENP
jgi:CDGSH-type Zn-finger protein